MLPRRTGGAATHGDEQLYRQDRVYLLRRLDSSVAHVVFNSRAPASSGGRLGDLAILGGHEGLELGLRRLRRHLCVGALRHRRGLVVHWARGFVAQGHDVHWPPRQVVCASLAVRCPEPLAARATRAGRGEHCTQD